MLHTVQHFAFSLDFRPLIKYFVRRPIFISFRLHVTSLTTNHTVAKECGVRETIPILIQVQNALLPFPMFPQVAIIGVLTFSNASSLTWWLMANRPRPASKAMLANVPRLEQRSQAAAPSPRGKWLLHRRQRGPLRIFVLGKAKLPCWLPGLHDLDPSRHGRCWLAQHLYTSTHLVPMVTHGTGSSIFVVFQGFVPSVIEDGEAYQIQRPHCDGRGHWHLWLWLWIRSLHRVDWPARLLHRYEPRS